MTECPNCHSKIFPISWKKDHETKMTIPQISKLVIKDKSFKAKKLSCETEVVNGSTEKPSLKIIKTEIWESDFNFDTKCQLEIKRDGVIVNNTKSNIQKALSHVNLLNTDENTLFRSVFDYNNETISSSGLVYEIIKNPFIEIFYNTYGNLKVIKHIPLFLMNREETEPHRIIGISGPVWREMIHISQDLGCNINKFFNQIKKLDEEYKDNPDYIVGLLRNIKDLGVNCFENYMSLVRKGFNCNRLHKYLTEDIYTYQGISDVRQGLTLLKDYVNMCETMNVAYDRYPKSLKLAHDLANKNLQIKMSQEQQGLFNEIINNDQYSYLEYKGTYYSVLKPKSTNDIIKEGRHLHHCVASYIEPVIRGKTKILFLRDNDDLDKPLITLEVQNNTLHQYKGNSERYPNKKEMKEIMSWANKKGLAIW